MNKLYSFETWARQLLDFTAHFVGNEAAFLICNSVGGAASAFLCLDEAGRAAMQMLLGGRIVTFVDCVEAETSATLQG